MSAPMQTILVPIDFSPVSRQVIDGALDLAKAIDARVVLLHVVQPPMVVSDLAPLVGESLKFTADVERGARRHLRSLKASLAKRGAAVDTLCEQGSPVPAIASHAKALDARYIVMGSHGHTAFYDLVVGSTASGVLKRAPCPVVVVPAQSKPKRGRSKRGGHKRAK